MCVCVCVCVIYAIFVGSLCDLIFRKTLLLEGELLNLLKKTPKIAPPEKKGKKKSKTPQM